MKEGLGKAGALCIPGLSPRRSLGSTAPDNVRESLEGRDLEVLRAALFSMPVPTSVFECFP